MGESPALFTLLPTRVAAGPLGSSNACVTCRNGIHAYAYNVTNARKRRCTRAILINPRERILYCILRNIFFLSLSKKKARLLEPKQGSAIDLIDAWIRMINEQCKNLLYKLYNYCDNRTRRNRIQHNLTLVHLQEISHFSFICTKNIRNDQKERKRESYFS